MKKALLFFLLLFVCFAHASDLTYEEFKHLLYEKEYLKAKGEYPWSWWELNEDDLSSLRPSKQNDKIDEGMRTNRLEKIERRLEDLSPAKIWTYVMKLDEELSFEHMSMVIRSDVIAPASSGQDMDVHIAADDLLYKNSGINGPPKMYFYFDEGSFTAFHYHVYLLPWFWYEGRKHLPEMWDDWYGCWKKEHQREKPRKVIVKALYEEAARLTFHFAPFIYEAIKGGDKTLEQYFKSSWPDGHTNENFVVWWEREKDNLTLPPCEGYRASMKRLNGKDTALNPFYREGVRNMCVHTEKYYSENEQRTNYWYRFLRSDYEYDEEGDEDMLRSFRVGDLCTNNYWRMKKTKNSGDLEKTEETDIKRGNMMDTDVFYDNTPASQPAPPMGWNSYCSMNCDPTEKDILEIAKFMADNGYLEAGYEYINVDDGWLEKERNEKGRLVARKDKFPHGMGFLAGRLHHLGFKAGIYLGCGVTTWHGDAGSLGHEFEDARQIAGWGFDYLKYDYHPAEGDPERNFIREYTKMGAALRASGGNIFYNLCEHGRSKPWNWAHGVGPMWRIGLDIRDQFDGKCGLWSVTDAMEKGMQPIADYARPGNYNDPDFLVCGMRHANDWMGPGCTDIEYRSNFGMWCFTAAPLMIGGDPRKFDAVAKEILTHKGYIALDKDPLCVQGRCYQKKGFDGQEYSLTNGYEVWRRELSSLRWAVALFNRSSEEKELSFTYRDIELEADWTAELTDLWSGESLGIITPKKPEEIVYKTLVAPHEFKILILKPRF